MTGFTPVSPTAAVAQQDTFGEGCIGEYTIELAAGSLSSPIQINERTTHGVYVLADGPLVLGVASGDGTVMRQFPTGAGVTNPTASHAGFIPAGSVPRFLAMQDTSGASNTVTVLIL
jgi:hypothetical protein